MWRGGKWVKAACRSHNLRIPVDFKEANSLWQSLSALTPCTSAPHHTTFLFSVLHKCSPHPFKPLDYPQCISPSTPLNQQEFAALADGSHHLQGTAEWRNKQARQRSAYLSQKLAAASYGLVITWPVANPKYLWGRRWQNTFTETMGSR